MKTNRLMGLLFLALLPWLLTAQVTWEDEPAKAAYDSLLQLADALPVDSAERKSYLLHQAGNAADGGGQLDLAIEATQRALDIRLTGGDKLADGLLVSAFNLGTYFNKREEYRLSLDYFGMVTNRAPNRKEGVAWFQTGIVYAKTGEFGAGEQAFARAADLAPFNDDGYYAVYLNQQLGGLHLQKFNQEGALLAIPFLEEAIDFFVAEEYFYQEMETRSDLGWALTEAGNQQAAIKELEKALQLAIDTEAYTEDFCIIYSNLGLAYRRAERADRALIYYHKALEMAEAEEMDVATYLTNISTVYLVNGQPDSALVYAQRALVAAVPDFKPAKLTDIPKIDDVRSGESALLIYLQDKARAHRGLAERGATEHYASTLATYRRADELLDQMRQNQLLEDTRNYWRADARKLYDEAIDAAIAGNDAEGLFYFAEKARARLLLDELSASRARDLLSPSVRKQLELVARATRLSSDDLAVFQRFHRFQDSLLTAFPDYAEARYGAPPPAVDRLEDIVDGRTLVEYFVGEKVTVALVKAPGEELRLVTLGASNIWQRALEGYLKCLHDPSVSLDVEAARSLYVELIEPLGLSSETSLIIVPDGNLYLLPFGALLSSEPQEGGAFQSWPWLAAERDIHYAFSVQLLDFARRRRGRGNGRALALAPVARLTKDGPLETRLELPATLRTVRHLAGLLPADTLINASANRSAFRDTADAYSLIHLGTHAYLEDGGSFLLYDHAPSRYTMADLTEHQLRADLVVMGACETGLGKALYGEGVASLGRGFARRGAPGIMMSLWSINDAATAELLNSVYDGLAVGTGPSEALYEAGMGYREAVVNPAFGHPYYWAGLVYYGPEEALGFGGGWSWWWVVLPGAVLVGGLLWRRFAPHDRGRA